MGEASASSSAGSTTLDDLRIDYTDIDELPAGDF
jgi:hypothetical protein